MNSSQNFFLCYFLLEVFNVVGALKQSDQTIWNLGFIFLENNDLLVANLILFGFFSRTFKSAIQSIGKATSTLAAPRLHERCQSSDFFPWTAIHTTLSAPHLTGVLVVAPRPTLAMEPGDRWLVSPFYSPMSFY